MNLHARLRYHRLPRYFGAPRQGEVRRVLDAGSGNGMLAYRASLLGNQVLGVSFKTSEVTGSTTLFNEFLGIGTERLRFEEGNLYALKHEDGAFDEIICAEVLEHLRRDGEVCASFHRLLKPGGVLHVCAPNADHPYNRDFPLDPDESGGHVRPGYTLESYRELLEPLGFVIEETARIGGPVRQWFNWRIKEIQARHGVLAGLPWFLVALPALWFESAAGERRMPFSLYVRARRVDVPGGRERG